MTTAPADPPITIEADRRRARARIHDHVIADSADALVLKEAGHGPVIYFPREDVETGFMSQSPLVTQCPYKGSATHYAIMIDGVVIEKAAWSYEDPSPAVLPIKGRIAFYPGEIEVYEVDEAALERHRRTLDQDGGRPAS